MKIRLMFGEQEKAPLLQDVSSLLYDFELLYDFCLVTSSEEYSGYRFSPSFWYRNRRGIKDVHMLRVSKMSKESPLSIELLLADSIAVFGVVLTFIQTAVMVYELRNRQKTELEIEKLKLEIAKLKGKSSPRKPQRTLRHENENTTLRVITKRLQTNSIKLEYFEIETESEDDKKVTFT